MASLIKVQRSSLWKQNKTKNKNKNKNKRNRKLKKKKKTNKQKHSYVIFRCHMYIVFANIFQSNELKFMCQLHQSLIEGIHSYPYYYLFFVTYRNLFYVCTWFLWKLEHGTMNTNLVIVSFVLGSTIIKLRVYYHYYYYYYYYYCYYYYYYYYY